MKEYHDNPLFGHVGFYKTYKKIKERYEERYYKVCSRMYNMSEK